MLTNYILTVVIFFPLLGALIVALYGRSSDGDTEGIKKLAIGISVAEFLISLPLAVLFKASEPGYQFKANTRWISSGCAAARNVLSSESFMVSLGLRPAVSIRM